MKEEEVFPSTNKSLVACPRLDHHVARTSQVRQNSRNYYKVGWDHTASVEESSAVPGCPLSVYGFAGQIEWSSHRGCSGSFDTVGQCKLGVLAGRA